MIGTAEKFYTRKNADLSDNKKARRTAGLFLTLNSFQKISVIAHINPITATTRIIAIITVRVTAVLYSGER